MMRGVSAEASTEMTALLGGRDKPGHDVSNFESWRR
jgi:hypothetical protein